MSKIPTNVSEPTDQEKQKSIRTIVDRPSKRKRRERGEREAVEGEGESASESAKL
jgi:hypothetical protein